jgi:CSLREA domain-containing protein
VKLATLRFSSDAGLQDASLIVVGSGGSPVFTVDTAADSVDANPGNGRCADSGGACSLRAAIEEADAISGQVLITVPVGTFALSIANPSPPFGVIPSRAFDPATGDLDVAGHIRIVGAGVGQSIVAAEYLDRVFEVASGANVVLQGLTIEHGQPFDCAGGVGIYNGGTLDLEQVDVFSNSGSCGSGGGIYNAGVLTANGTTIDGNSASSGGGGLYNAGTATFSASTFSGNSVTFGGGGGITNSGSLTLTNVTLSGNAAASSNGGALRLSAGSAALQNVTMVSNHGGGSGGGGALRFDGGSVTMQNTLLAYNTGIFGSPANCANGTPTSLGSNIADLADCHLTGTGDISSTDPLAAALADNGGPVQTSALQDGSPAVDAGAGCAATDARGVIRPQGSACDIGAYEAPPPPPVSTFTLTLTVGGSGTVTSNPAGIACPSTCSATYASGTSVTLTATPASGNTFSGWSGACSDTGGCTFSITAATAVGAAFALTPTTTTTTTTTTPAPSAAPAPPKPRIAFTPNSPVAGQPVQFSGSVADASVVTYHWSFGDGIGAEGQQVSHAYGSAGTYLVTVTATDSSGATGTAQATLTVPGTGRVFGGRVGLLSSFGPGDPDPGLAAPAGLTVEFFGASHGAQGALPMTQTATTTLGGVYGLSQLPLGFAPVDVVVLTAAGKLLGRSDPGNGVSLVLGWGRPAVVSRDFSVVPDANSFVVSGRALAPSGSLPAGVVVQVSVEGRNFAGALVASGSVQSGGFGGYRVEAKPTAAFVPGSGLASMRINRLAVKLSENGVVVDSTETTVSGGLVLADGHSFTTRDLHG